MEKENTVEKVNFDFSKHFNTDAGYKELFKDIGMQGYKILELNKLCADKDLLISKISTVDSKTGENKTILVYGVLGEPTFKQLLEVGYDHGSNIDIRIIMFYHPGESTWELMNNKRTAQNFVDIFNDCHEDTYLVNILDDKKDIDDSQSFSGRYQFKIITDPDSERKTPFRKLPSKKQFQEGELWNYYADFIGANDPPIELGGPGYLVADGDGFGWSGYSNGLTKTCLWNDDGIAMIAIAHDEKGNKELQHIYGNKVGEIQEIFINCNIKLKLKKKNYWLIVEVDKRPISSFFNCNYDEKYDFVDELRGYEMRFDQFINDYFYELETRKEAI